MLSVMVGWRGGKDGGTAAEQRRNSGGTIAEQLRNNGGTVAEQRRNSCSLRSGRGWRVGVWVR